MLSVPDVSSASTSIFVLVFCSISGAYTWQVEGCTNTSGQPWAVLTLGVIGTGSVEEA